MDIMFDEEVLLDSIAAEHHTINHKLDLCFVVVPFVTSSEKFHISSIWKIVYFVCYVLYIVVSSYGDAYWSRSHSYQSFAICSNNDMTHRPCNQNVWRLEMWTVNRQPGTMSLRKSFSKDVWLTLLNMKRIKFSWCMPISNHISFVIFDIVFGTIHSYLSIIIISIPQNLAFVSNRHQNRIQETLSICSCIHNDRSW